MKKEIQEIHEDGIGGWKPSVATVREGLGTARKITEKSGAFTFDYNIGTDMLRIGMPLDMWCRARNSLDEAARYLGMKMTEGLALKALDMWAFISCMDWIREFPQKVMTGVLGITHTTFSQCVKLLGTSGLCVIDKSKKAANSDRKERGKYYQWWPRVLGGEFKGEITWSGMMRLKGTGFGRMTGYYVASCDETVFRPERIITNEVYPPGTYIPPYHMLEYRYSGRSFKARMYESWWVALAASAFGKDPVYSGRLYNGFHYLPGVLRKNVYYDGSPLVEAFDLHCSFYTLSVGLIKERYPDADDKALERFFYDCVSGRLYDRCADYIGAPRDEAKRLLQGWRNLWNRGTAHNPVFGYSGVAGFMEKYYPEISDIYYGWETREEKAADGKTVYRVKNLQRDLNEYETRVISELSFNIMDKYDVTPFTLHDAIYVSENDKGKLPCDINEIIIKWLKDKIL